MKGGSKRCERSLQTGRKQPPNEMLDFAGRILNSKQQTDNHNRQTNKRKQKTNESNDKTTARSLCGRKHKDATPMVAPLSATASRDGYARRQTNTSTQYRGVDSPKVLHRRSLAKVTSSLKKLLVFQGLYNLIPLGFVRKWPFIPLGFIKFY